MEIYVLYQEDPEDPSNCIIGLAANATASRKQLTAYLNQEILNCLGEGAKNRCIEDKTQALTAFDALTEQGREGVLLGEGGHFELSLQLREVEE